MIRPPCLPADDPDYDIQCEEALDFAINEVGDAAIEAGWSEEAVEAAMMRIAESRYMARISDEKARQIVGNFPGKS